MTHFVIPSCAACLLEGAVQVLNKATGISSNQDVGRGHPLFDMYMKSMQEFLRILRDFNEKSFPALIASDLMRAVKKITGNPDPYKAEREKSNLICLKFYESLKADLSRQGDSKARLRKALFLTIAGNNIDYITPGHTVTLTEEGISQVLDEVEQIGLVKDDFELLWDQVSRRHPKVLYLLDNAGEIVFDKLVMGILKDDLGINVTAVVKGGPVANDVLWEDAEMVRLSENCTHIITTGTDDVGFNWDKASAEFKAGFEGEPLVISKGQANFEAINIFGLQMPPMFFFAIFKIKCPANAAIAGGKKGEQVILRVMPS